MKIHTLAIVTLATVIASACGSSLQVETVKPGKVSTGLSERILLSEGFGRLSAQDMTARAVRDSVRVGGWFDYQDRTGDLSLDVRNGAVELNASGEIPERSLILRVDAIEFFTHDTIETRQVRDNGETFDAAIPVIEAVALFQITAADETGALILDQVEYEARVAADEADRPRDDDLLERAARAAMDLFIADISPERIGQRIPLDTDDERLSGAIDLAVKGQLDVAQVEFERFLEDHPGHAGAQYNLAAVLDAQREFDAAIDAYALALELEANSMYASTRSDCQQRLAWSLELGR